MSHGMTRWQGHKYWVGWKILMGLGGDCETPCPFNDSLPNNLPAYVGSLVPLEVMVRYFGNNHILVAMAGWNLDISRIM